MFFRAGLLSQLGRYMTTIEMVSSVDGSLTWGTAAVHRDHCHHRLFGHSWSILSFFPQPPRMAQGLVTNLVVMITAAYDKLPNGRHTDKHTQDIPFFRYLNHWIVNKKRKTDESELPPKQMDLTFLTVYPSEAWLPRLGRVWRLGDLRRK